MKKFLYGDLHDTHLKCKCKEKNKGKRMEREEELIELHLYQNLGQD